METKRYDYIVIGGGSGGGASADRAAEGYGVKTLLVERGVAGGTCINLGCVPKKVTWNYSNVNETHETGERYGFSSLSDVKINYKNFKDTRDALVNRVNSALEKRWISDGVDIVRGQACFVEPKTVEVSLNEGGKERFTAHHILLAVGARPTMPNTKGAEHGITSDDFYTLEELPPKVAIVGAGYVGVEKCGMLAALGVETHMFIRGKELLQKFDPMIAKAITERCEAAGVHVHRNHAGFKEVQLLHDGKGADKLLKLIGKDGEVSEFNELLWAVGRQPNSEGLNLDIPGVKCNEKGYIIADEYQNTSAPGIYAVGDVSGQAELCPVSFTAGRRLSTRLFGPPEFKSIRITYEDIPSVVFSHPEVGIMGLTEPKARERFGDDNITIYQISFTDTYHAVVPPDEQKKSPTDIKLICAGPEEKVVGLHALGMGITEMIQGFGIAIKMGATRKDFSNCVAVHPTNSEELVDMFPGVHDFRGQDQAGFGYI